MGSLDLIDSTLGLGCARAVQAREWSAQCIILGVVWGTTLSVFWKTDGRSIDRMQSMGRIHVISPQYLENSLVSFLSSFFFFHRIMIVDWPPFRLVGKRVAWLFILCACMCCVHV